LAPEQGCNAALERRSFRAQHCASSRPGDGEGIVAFRSAREQGGDAGGALWRRQAGDVEKVPIGHIRLQLFEEISQVRIAIRFEKLLKLPTNALAALRIPMAHSRKDFFCAQFRSIPNILRRFADGTP
jgi:hypothetical protein